MNRDEPWLRPRSPEARALLADRSRAECVALITGYLRMQDVVRHLRQGEGDNLAVQHAWALLRHYPLITNSMLPVEKMEADERCGRFPMTLRAARVALDEARRAPTIRSEEFRRHLAELSPLVYNAPLPVVMTLLLDIPRVCEAAVRQVLDANCKATIMTREEHDLLHGYPGRHYPFDGGWRRGLGLATRGSAEQRLSGLDARLITAKERQGLALAFLTMRLRK
jgi:hypothetical protein